MEVVTGTARLAVPPGSAAMVVKNLYVSCDPYMRGRMTKHDRPSYVPDFVVGEVSNRPLPTSRILFYHQIRIQIIHKKRDRADCFCLLPPVVGHKQVLLLVLDRPGNFIVFCSAIKIL
jgi:hypothetical protein